MKIVADTVNGCEYLTAGKPYTVLQEHAQSMRYPEQRTLDILSDTGLRITVLLKDCPHIAANWRIVEYETDKEALDEISRLGQEMQPEMYVTDEEEEEEWERMEEKQEVSAGDILRAGLKHMDDRASTYDKPEGERSMKATVDAFNAVTDGKMDTEEKGWLFMVLLKCVRSQQGNFKLDNYEDGAAYFGLMGETANGERK